MTTAAELLVGMGAVQINTADFFRYSSGMRSPIYCDNRMFISDTRFRRVLIHELCATIKRHAGDSWDVVAGVATAAIPFAAWVAAEFDKPMIYVRDRRKDYGKKRLIEGSVHQHQTAIVVEDLVTTGTSALSAIAILRNHGLICQFCFSNFDYSFHAAASRFQAGGVEHISLSTLHDLVELLRGSPGVDEREIDAVLTWHRRENRELLVNVDL